MKSLVCKLDINAKARFYTLEGIRIREPDFDKWTLRNDMIKSVVVDGCEHGFLSLGIDYESGRQGVGYGHRSEGNIGLMICALSDLLETRYDNGDALARMAGKPIRVMSNDISVLRSEHWRGYCPQYALADGYAGKETYKRIYTAEGGDHA